ncbi:MAG: methyl-accepting chemotaxis protein [Spirochaetota bacterium]|nr:MAG: methyl-accepting chemotaxis protein [Spirochaetota bacterium]
MDRKRKRFIIEGNFQARLILRFVVIVVGVTLLSTGAILGLFYFKYEFGGIDLGSMVIRATAGDTSDVSNIFQVVFVPLLAANLLVLIISVPFSLLYSHKIAGPIYRFEQSFDLLLSGENDFMIVLRKRDEFKYLADKINALIDYMRRNIEEVRISHKLIKKRISEILRLAQDDVVNIEAIKGEVLELDRFFKERKEPFSY